MYSASFTDVERLQKSLGPAGEAIPQSALLLISALHGRARNLRQQANYFLILIVLAIGAGVWFVIIADKLVEEDVRDLRTQILIQDKDDEKKTLAAATVAEERKVVRILNEMKDLASRAGEVWTSVTSTADNSLWSVNFADPQTAIAVGERGTIVRSDDGGRTWSSVTNTDINHLWSVDFADHQTAIAVGAGGTILRSEDGGKIWNVDNKLS